MIFTQEPHPNISGAKIPPLDASRCEVVAEKAISFSPSLSLPRARAAAAALMYLGDAVRSEVSSPSYASLAAAGPALQCFAQVRDLTLDRASLQTETS